MMKATNLFFAVYLEKGCWLRQSPSLTCSLLILLGRKKGQWACNAFLPTDQNLHSCFKFLTLCGSIFPCFRPSVYSFVLHKQVCQWLSDTLLKLTLPSLLYVSKSIVPCGAFTALCFPWRLQYQDAIDRKCLDLRSRWLAQ